MSVVRPRAVIHRGVIEASGFVFEPALVGEAVCRRRILALWEAGSKLFEIDERYVLLLAEPRQVRCEHTRGLALVERNRRWLATPLCDDELDALGAPAGALVWSRGGRACWQALGSEHCIDPSEWIELDGFAVVELDSVAPIERPLERKPPVAVTDAREVFAKRVPEADERVEAVARRLVEAERADAGDAQDTGALMERQRTRSFLGMLMNAVFLPISRVLSSGGGQSGGGRSGSGSHESHAEPEQSVNPLARWLRTAAARFLMWSHLSWLVGRRQAKYLRDMVRMFERGELDEALKHAVPLSSRSDGEFAGPTLGTPSARDEISLSRRKTRISSSMGADVGLFKSLRDIYRRAFEALDRRGEVEKAAFVLLELLDQPIEAVDYLETHDELELAAEIAEGHDLPAALVVRLWFLAGDLERAMLVARRTGAFAGAVARLEQSDPEKADVLRVHWADHLASSGDYRAAVDTLWPVEQARHIAVAWIERGIAVGGPVAARMYARKAELLPEQFHTIREPVLELIEGRSPDRALERNSLVQALIGAGHNEALEVMRRAAARMMARTGKSPAANFTHDQATAMAAAADDFALLEDLQRVTFATASGRPELPVSYTVATQDVGSMHIYDAARLADGRILVALGEVGVRLIDRNADVLAHFDEPAHGLVISDHGERAIAVAEREDRCRLSRLDLVDLSSSHWCYAAIDQWVDTYDGSIWFAARSDTLLGVDAMADDFATLWRVPKLDGEISDMQRSRQWLNVAIGNEEVWKYELPSLTLRERVEFADEHGGLALWDRVAVVAHETVSLVDVKRSRIEIEVELAGAEKTNGARLDERWLTIWDEHGRLLVFETSTLRLDSDLRL